VIGAAENDRAIRRTLLFVTGKRQRYNPRLITNTDHTHRFGSDRLDDGIARSAIVDSRLSQSDRAAAVRRLARAGARQDIGGVSRVNRFDLTNRRAVVTGSAQGIGRAIAERFLASGAAVSFWDKDERELDATLQDVSSYGPTHKVVVDVTSYPAVEAAVAATVGALGGIDILVANAGITGPNNTTWEYPIDAWQKVIDLNLTGVFYCCRAVVPHMIAAGYGRIVNISSVAGKEGNPNAPAYSASKAGVIALTKSLGKELATHNIAVNCITPAAAKTRIFEQMTQSHIDYMLSKIPRNRFLEVHEVASLAAWLACEENSFSTAAVFDITGGRSTY
jgi:NAD(P)-dependent dehydrogenase (short-subunit alcohol dehydrogenase family)